jgi:hypothetical protein
VPLREQTHRIESSPTRKISNVVIPNTLSQKIPSYPHREHHPNQTISLPNLPSPNILLSSCSRSHPTSLPPRKEVTRTKDLIQAQNEQSGSKPRDEKWTAGDTSNLDPDIKPTLRTTIELSRASRLDKPEVLYQSSFKVLNEGRRAHLRIGQHALRATRRLSMITEEGLM